MTHYVDFIFKFSFLNFAKKYFCRLSEIAQDWPALLKKILLSTASVYNRRIPRKVAHVISPWAGSQSFELSWHEPIMRNYSTNRKYQKCAIFALAEFKNSSLLSDSSIWKSLFFLKFKAEKKASISFFCFLSSEVKKKQLGNARKLNSLVTRLTAQSQDHKAR